MMTNQSGLEDIRDSSNKKLEDTVNLAVASINLSMAISIETPSKIDLAAMDTTKLNGNEQQFANWLRDSSRVVYDWGKAVFYTSDEPFVIDRAAKTITPTPEENHWAGIQQDDLFRIAGNAWIGEWSPLAADAVLTLLNSGVDVEIVNSGEYGPSDPVQFIQNLRTTYNLPFPTSKS
jgi:hypothetical protein